MQATQSRYAIYFAPAPDSALWRFGSAVLGYDAASGLAVEQHRIEGLSRDAMAALTEEPRRYGFHATLKAPFHLTEGRDELELLAMAANLAAQLQPVSLSGLQVAVLGDFVAFVPSTAADAAALAGLAARTVEAFEPFRAPLAPADIARRKPELLPMRQRDNLERWGYPYVFEDFRFHMTLTGRIPDRQQRDHVLERLLLAAAALPPAPPVDRLVVFRQPTRQSRFSILDSYAFAASCAPDREAAP